MAAPVPNQIGHNHITPAAQATTDSDAVLAGSELDARNYANIAYTLKAATNAITWTVFGANLKDFSDEVQVQAPASVAVGTVGSFAPAGAPYAFYRVKIRATTPESQGQGTLAGLAK